MTIATLQPTHRGNHFRAYGLRSEAALIDPFLGVDHAWMSAPTFPLHSHVGFSAVSYLFLDSETGLTNRDSIGSHNLIQPGGLHWATAGRGIVHEEIPDAPGKTVHSLQIFVNLPPDLQSCAPFALSLEPQDVPIVQLPGAKVRVPTGSFGDVRSPLVPPTEVTLLDISLDAGAELAVPVAAGHCAIVMPIHGAVSVDGQVFAQDELRLPILQSRHAERVIRLQAPRGAAKAMFFGGAPLHASAT